MRLSKKTQRLLVIGAAAIVVGALVVLTIRFYRIFDSLPRIKALVEQLGFWGPVGIIAFQTIQIVIAPVPGTLIEVASGYLFGPVLGVICSMVGILCGTTLALLLSRALGRRIILLFMKKETLAKWDGRFQKWSLKIIFLLYLVPNPLGDMVSYLAGLSAWPIPTLLLVAVLGRLPFVIVHSFIGHRSTFFSAKEILLVVAGFIAVSIIYFLLRNKIERLFLRKRD